VLVLLAVLTIGMPMQQHLRPMAAASRCFTGALCPAASSIVAAAVLACCAVLSDWRLESCRPLQQLLQVQEKPYCC
jgi:hypothetical protein